MYFRPRHRRGTYPLAQEHTLPRGLRLLIAIGALAVAAYLLWTLMLSVFGISGGLERAGATLMVEDRGTVSVSIDGKQQRAENGMLIFPGESVTTGAGAHASLLFFDGSKVRLNDATAITVVDSGRGSSESRITLNMEQGTIWALRAAQPADGTVSWSVTTPTLDFAVDPGTEAILSPRSLAVFTTEGQGVSISLSGHSDFVISEGQQWAMPTSGSVGSDVLAFRSPLDPLAARATFVVESRQLLAGKAGHGSSSARNENSDILTVSSPAPGAILRDVTLAVRGTVGAGVTSVTVNGYPAVLDASKGTFSQQVSPAEGEMEFDVTVRALDADGNILSEVHRSVKRAPPGPLAAPTVTTPAKDGQTYHTLNDELILRGTAPTGAVGIMVNDYKLQLFDPTKGEWSYVASIRLQNMLPGVNTYDVIAIDAAGKKSPAARITIMQGGEGPEGVVAGTSSSTAAGGSSSSGPLPTNAPLLPGTLTVTAPEAGTSMTYTGTGFLLEGTTAAKTATIAVNDYTLQLYKPGKTTWNYIVEARLNNLKKGKNVYTIVARNKNQEILDQLTYTVDYQPK